MNYQIREFSIHVEVHGTAERLSYFSVTGVDAPGARLSGATSVLLSAIGLQRDPHRSVK